MQKTKIEWTDYVYNPVKGLCPGVYTECAEFCYARKIYKRFNFDPIIRLDKKELNCPMPKKPSRIFTGSTFDYSFARESWIIKILDIIKNNPQHTFIFLTKNPNLYDNFVFPINCWLGMMIFGSKKNISSGQNIERYLFLKFKNMDLPNLKFISFEPLLRDTLGDEDLKGIGWVIIGAQTRPNIQPKPEWVNKIIHRATINKCKIFLKDNLEYNPDKLNLNSIEWKYLFRQIPKSKEVGNDTANFSLAEN